MDTVAVRKPDNLAELAATLRKRLGVGSIFQMLNTRLVIQYGVNLKNITPEQNGDGALLARVRVALVRMGINLEGGQS
jgi:hypothetical protein